MGAGTCACSFFYPTYKKSELILVEKKEISDSSYFHLLKPFQDSLSAEMNVVLTYSNISTERGRPCSPLNNWVADAIYTQQLEQLKDTMGSKMVLLNFGGIRSTINKGDVTTKDIYSLMPFDNLVVWLKMPKSALKKIEYYLTEKGGEPIAGATLKKGKIEFNKNDTLDYFWVITSDYLANGGDKMDFFLDRISLIETNKLLRESLIEACKRQNVISWNHDCRIELE